MKKSLSWFEAKKEKAEKEVSANSGYQKCPAYPRDHFKNSEIKEEIKEILEDIAWMICANDRGYPDDKAKAHRKAAEEIYNKFVDRDDN